VPLVNQCFSRNNFILLSLRYFVCVRACVRACVCVCDLVQP